MKTALRQQAKIKHLQLMKSANSALPALMQLTEKMFAFATSNASRNKLSESMPPPITACRVYPIISQPPRDSPTSPAPRETFRAKFQTSSMPYAVGVPEESAAVVSRRDWRSATETLRTERIIRRCIDGTRLM